MDLEKFGGCTAQAGISIVYDNIYCASSMSKTGKKLPVVFQKYSGCFSGGQKKTTSCFISTKGGDYAQDIAVHVNSLTYHNHIFYIATMNEGTNANQVIAFNANGEILANYTYNGEKTIGTINYYDTANGDLRFLVSLGHGKNVNFQLVKINGGRLINVENKNFIATVPYKDFDRGNDHYYDLNTKQLYVTKFKEPGSGDITTNLVLQYDLSGSFFG